MSTSIIFISDILRSINHKRELHIGTLNILTNSKKKLKNFTML